MEAGVKTQFCAICGRTHDPNIACASVSGFEALEERGDKIPARHVMLSFMF
jgi:hypothetical protein